jgi:hypothetical protein
MAVEQNNTLDKKGMEIQFILFEMDNIQHSEIQSMYTTL